MQNILETPDLQFQIDTLSQRVKQQDLLIAKLQKLISYYEEQFSLQKRKLYGTSSQKTDPDLRQINLFGDADDVPIPELEMEEVTYKRKKRKGKREEDLSNLPVERIDYELSESERSCPECGETMGDIGIDVRRELKIIPAQVVVAEHAAHTYACGSCRKNSDSTPIVKAQGPVPLIAGSLASPSLVAHIIMQKYSNGMPLYRIEQGFQYDGVKISRQVMSGWVIKCVEMYLILIYTLLKIHLLNESVIHGDDTHHQVLREPGRKPQTKSYEWLYRTSEHSEKKIVIFDYQETRKYEHPKAFLAEFKGILHADGFEGYHELPDDIIVVGCWFHARQYWENLLKTVPKEKREQSDAWRGLSFINKLFELERSYKNLTPEERFNERLAKSKPISDAFFDWVEKLDALPKSLLGKATYYALSQRKYLENVYLDGRAELSNNRAERSIKRFVIGRKAWLFSVSPEGARASAILYSIVETAKENGLVPFQYLNYLLEKLPSATTAEVNELLPWSTTLHISCRRPSK